MKGAKSKIYSIVQAQELVGKFIPTSQHQLVKNADEIIIKAPLVLKIVSKDALHKTEIKGVRIVHSDDKIGSEFEDLLSVAKKNNLRLEGIMVQKFEEGIETIIGIKKDPVFGHVVLFGLGGVFAEALEDVSIRKCPINEDDAREMISELKAHKVFEGFRGMKLDIRNLERVLVKVSGIPLKHKDLKELDINPFILGRKGGVSVDSRAIFESS